MFDETEFPDEDFTGDFSYLLTSTITDFLVNNYALWLIPLILMVWTYRWVIINYIKALICQRSVIPIITVDQFLDTEGELVLAKAVHIINLAVGKPNATTIVLIMD